ncbi:helix-turn-helix domain-containing protein [Deinococcus radiophilus]|uniref:XRE family transcriptional regulator n=1 Tax=Deinococcus radiophilus TaxID=32062 RepID=A0A3S0JMZ5_9DEIO|nr:helix-turn-helix transcriptional regulator [Deinococcus radiophilus]RTR25394.1 XRE family transcriptional regulator [Deinococcus radiophilus]UFA50034.1 helix-turn-helix transcriptional regulator [Deinococcus radiophilus]
MKLHERLRELRSERKLRLKDVSEVAEISVPYLSDLERGRTNPSLDTLQTLAAAYGISVHDLLEGVEFYGESGEGALPKGLADLIADPVLGAQLSPDWVRTLSRIELRGKRPEGKQDWYEIYLHLKRILD